MEPEKDPFKDSSLDRAPFQAQFEIFRVRVDLHASLGPQKTTHKHEYPTKHHFWYPLYWVLETEREILVVYAVVWAPSPPPPCSAGACRASDRTGQFAPAAAGHAGLSARGLYPSGSLQLAFVTQRLQCSSFLVMTYFPLRDYNILPKKELHWSLWVALSNLC